MINKGLYNKSDNENYYNENPMLPQIQPYPLNPNGLPTNTFEQNYTPFPNNINNFTTPVVITLLSSNESICYKIRNGKYLS